MTTSQWLVRALLLPLLPAIGVLAGCNPQDDREDETTRKQGALTRNLFQPYVAYPTGSYPEAVAIGDLDSDGRNDIALFTGGGSDPANDKTVHVFLQAADGSLKPRVKYLIGQGGHSIDIGDVNGDGRADVVVGVSNGSGIKIGVLLQNAAGTLDPATFYTTVNSSEVKIGDYNGDGRMDVAGINHGGYDDGVDILLQTETGTLAPPVTYHAPHGGFDELEAGDIDGDGRTDLVVMSGQSNIPNVSILLQTAAGTFGTATSYALNPFDLTHGVALGDTNGDGRTDIIVGAGLNVPDAAIARFSQNAQGTMDPAVSYPALYQDPRGVVLADVDADGRKDVLVTHFGSRYLGVFRQFPEGDFGGEETYPVGYYSQDNPQSLAVGDINGDGRPDAVIADSNAGLIVLRHSEEASLALSVKSPSGSVYVGASAPVTWSLGDNVPIAGFDVSASFNGGSTCTAIPGCTGLPAAARECPWTPTGPTTYNVRVRVTARDNTGQTVFAERTFNLIAPAITVNSPYSAEYVGVASSVTWSHNLPPGGTVRIELTRDGGSSWETLDAAAPNTGRFAWTVTGPTTTTARVRVTDNGSFGVVGLGSLFSIRVPALTVTGPAAGATVYSSAITVTWTHNVQSASTVRIELSRDGGATFQTIAAWASAGSTTGSFTGSAPGADTTNAVVRVTTNDTIVASGTSAPFTLLAPPINVTSPAAGATVLVGAPMTITWSTTLPASSLVSIEFSRNGGSTYQVMAAAVPNTGSFTWTPAEPTSSARVRVTANEPGAGTSTSGVFTIIVPALYVSWSTATVYVGTSAVLSWSSNVGGPARIELTRDGGSTFETLADGLTGGVYVFVGTGPDTTTARLRVTLNVGVSVSAMTSQFSIVTPTITVTGPSAGAVVQPGTPVNITWTRTYVGPPVSIELSRDGGATYAVLQQAPNSGSFTWTATGPETSAARVRVRHTGSPAVGEGPTFQILTPTASVTSPAANAVWAIGGAQTVTWLSNLPATATARIELSRDAGGSWETLAAAAPNTGSFALTAPGPFSVAARVRVTVSASSASASAVSGGFSIVTPALIVTGPAAGTLAYAGTPVVVTWVRTYPATSPVSVEVSRDGGGTYELLAGAVEDTGSFSWTATGPDTVAAQFRIKDLGGLASGVGSLFQIIVPSVSVTSPAAGVVWPTGSAQTITWTSTLPGTAQAMIQLSRSGGTNWETLATGVQNTGSFAFTVTGPDAVDARVRVWVSNGPPPVNATSAAFSIFTPALTVTGPAAGTVVSAGTPVNVTWTHNLSGAEPVTIELSRDGGLTFETLAFAAPNTGSFAWIATGPDTAEARVRVTAGGALAASGIGPAFQILTSVLTVSSPVAGESWATGTARTIAWTSNLPAGNTVRVELSRDGGATWTSLSASAPASGSLGWTTTGPATSTAIVRVSSNGAVPAVAASGLFAIGAPAITVASPAADASWTIGNEQTITWTSNLLPSTTVKVQLSRNGGSTWTTLSSSAPNTGSYVWTATGSASTTAVVRVVANGISATGLSGTFSLVAGSVVVTAPNTAVTWTIGTVQAITWTHNAGAGAQFKIEVSRAGVWSVVEEAVPASDATSGSYAWTVTGPKATNAKVRITWTANTAAKDTSDVAFKIN